MNFNAVNIVKSFIRNPWACALVVVAFWPVSLFLAVALLAAIHFIF